MDAEEKLVNDAELAVAVWVGTNADGQPTLNLICLDGVRLNSDAQAILDEQCCRYIGVFGYMPDGTVQSQPVDWSLETAKLMLAAIPHFVEFAAPRIVAKRQSDSADWLTRLHTLPDTRA